MSTSFYYHFLFSLTLFSCLYMSIPVRNTNLIVQVPSKWSALFLSIVVGCVIASLPIPWNTGADRDLYVYSYVLMQEGFFDAGKDILWGNYMKICSLVMNYSLWLFLTAFIYCFNYYLFCYKLLDRYVYIGVLMFFTSLLFYNYGTNTIRAGFAASFLLLSFCNCRNKFLFYLFIIIAVGCHKSMLIPASAMVISRYYDKTFIYLLMWIVSIFLSAVLGSFFENIFASIAIDSRTSYLNVDADDTLYKVGFRLDFILYSCLPVFMGYYFVIKKKYKDKMYSMLFNTYLLANSFWILVIRANFSDRFAYLSWFIYPVLLIYPLLKEKIVFQQKLKIVGIVFFHELFTYIMFLR